MKLDENDYREIAAMISVGSNVIWYDKDGETLSLSCTFETEGYDEDDYFEGTGAFVETFRSLCVDKAECYDDDGNTTPCNIDAARLEVLVA